MTVSFPTTGTKNDNYGYDYGSGIRNNVKERRNVWEKKD